MPYTRPIPDREPRAKPSGLFGGSGLFSAWVQAEKMIQIALVLPSAAFVGWVAGVWLDSRLHQSWIGLAGIVLGGVSGLVYVVRLALATNRDEEVGAGNGKRTGK